MTLLFLGRSSSLSSFVLAASSPNQKNQMASNSKLSDFVLDEGLDDDEDVLAFHAHRPRNNVGTYEDQHQAEPQNQQHVTDTEIVIIDGMPPKTTRDHLNSFLSPSANILSLHLQQIPSPSTLRARITFDSPSSAQAALSLDGAPFPPANTPVSIKPYSLARWQANISTPQQPLSSTPPPSPALPAAAISSFWSAVTSARSVAERLEKHAKRVAVQLEETLHVSEKVSQTQAAARRVDNDLQISAKAAELAAAGRAAAGEIDASYGISRQMGKIVDDVGTAARTVANEVDENLRISEKAREATNAALAHDGVGPVVRSVVDGIGSGSENGNGKKKYTPSEVREKDEDQDFSTPVGVVHGIGEE